MTVGTFGVGGDGTCARAAGETSSRDPGVAGTCGEDVGVSCEHYVGHHAAGAGAGGEDFGGVGVVLLESELDHVVEALVVAASVAREALGSVDFPAVAVFLGGGEDGDEALLLGEGIVFSRLGIKLASAATAM